MSDKTLVSTSCPYCIGYTDAAGFHHGFNCPILIPEQFTDWDDAKTPFGELQDIATDLKVENNALRAQHVAEMEAKVEALEWRDKEICTLRKQLYDAIHDKQSAEDARDVYKTNALRVRGERDELQRKLDIAVEAIRDDVLILLHEIQSSQKGSIGSIDNTYLPQMSRRNIDAMEKRINNALAEIEKVGKDANEKL